MKIKKIISTVLISAVMFSTVANAAVLGTESISHSRIDIGEGAVLEKNVFYGDQSGVGYQSEYFVEYTPNSTLVPAVINDLSLYGRLTASQMSDILLNDGKYPSMLINSDFFALETGIPMSHQVIDHRLAVQDISQMDALGINDDSTAFIAPLQIKTEITANDTTIPIEVFNKLRQPYVIYMYDDQFADTTKAKDPGLNVIIGSLSSHLSVGETITGIVEEVVHSEGEIEIPKGKIVLSADDRVPEEVMDSLKSFAVGDKLSIKVYAEGDERWNDAKHILGAWGGRIITAGVITEVDEDAAPRTAIGIKEDGSLIFYTLDGRQQGHSYGARLRTLAKRLLELGCVDAINLDGGGSTTMGGFYPGEDSFSIINKPSDKAERKVATFVGLINTAPKTNKAEKLFVYPYGENYLSGATETFTALATDKNYYAVPLNSEITYTAPDGKVSDTGKIKITGDGRLSVKAVSGELQGKAEVNVYKTPTDIVLTNIKTKKSVTSVKLTAGEKIELDATAKVGNKVLKGDDSCFKWECSDNIGTISNDGTFVSFDTNAEGTISVTAGEKTKTINVKVAKKNPYPQIAFTETKENTLEIYIEADDYKPTKENTVVKVDGKEIELAFGDNKMSVTFTDGYMHKVTVITSNPDGLSSVATYTAKGNEHKNIFADVGSSHWAKSYITYMNKHNVIKGSPVGKEMHFNPDDNITRGEFAVMVANFLSLDLKEFEDEQITFADKEYIPSWCIDHAKALNILGIMQGKGAGGKTYFDSSAPLSRAEAAAVISRILPDKVETKELVFKDKEEIPSWAKDSFTKLCSLGVINGYSDNTVRCTNKITRSETVKMLFEIY
jgi:hypothetical protein